MTILQKIKQFLHPWRKYDRSVKLLVDGKESQNAESVGLNADTVMGFICPNSIAFRYPGSEQMDSLFKHVDVSYH